MSRGLFPVLVEEKTDASSYWDTDAENPIFKIYVGKLELKIVISAKLELQLRQIKMEIMMAVAYLCFTNLPLRLRPACKTKVKKHNKSVKAHERECIWTSTVVLSF
ncbi:hypothetical protein MAR_035469 [Mya arenaria]|uniref:Uncharacterized protein n=1 Tax=Mya arenaria TaxID=6604 RepID=A0ABY7EK68_MYAAR|nr:hypothetical protein MAR_035469 [Mya arenaria]